jgi:hypothetical protein
VKNILAKIAKGETLTDAEKETVGKFDLQAEIDKAASGARKKAEAETKAAKDALEALKGEFETFKIEHDPAKKQTETEKLMKRIEKLEADKAAADARSAALERTAKVRALQKDAGIVPAKGVASDALDLLVDNLTRELDLDDADAVKAAFDGFKSANAAMIAANTVGGAGQKGTSGAGAFTGKNPFSKKSFNLSEQLQLKSTDPAKYAELKAAAEAETE